MPIDPSLPTLYTRSTSNNSRRLTLYLSLRRTLLLGSSSAAADRKEIVNVVDVTHEEQLLIPENLTKKVPVLVFPAGYLCGRGGSPTSPASSIRSLSESECILDYLASLPPPSPLLPPSPSLDLNLSPSCPLTRARMRQIIRTHDLYISSPNSHHSTRNLHTQACMYIPPPAPSARRGVPAATRHVLLSDLFAALRLLDSLVLPSTLPRSGGYSCGPSPTLADLAVFPTLLYCVHYMARVYGYDVVSPGDCGDGDQWRMSLLASGTVATAGRGEEEGRRAAVEAWVERGCKREEVERAEKGEGGRTGNRPLSEAVDLLLASSPVLPSPPPQPGSLWRGMPNLFRVYATCVEGELWRAGGREMLEALDCGRLNDVVERIREDLEVNGGEMDWVLN